MTDAVSLGKGAWDCDANREIPPEKEVRDAQLYCLAHADKRTCGH